MQARIKNIYFCVASSNNAGQALGILIDHMALWYSQKGEIYIIIRNVMMSTS